MHTEWKRSFNPEEQEKLESILGNKFLVESFLKIIDRMIAEEEAMELSLKAYENPSWAYKQADLNGARRAYSKIKNLFKESKTNG